MRKIKLFSPPKWRKIKELTKNLDALTRENKKSLIKTCPLLKTTCTIQG